MVTIYDKSGSKVLPNSEQGKIIQGIYDRQRQDKIDNEEQTKKYLNALSGNLTGHKAESEKRDRGQRLGKLLGFKSGLDFDTRSSRRSAESRSISTFNALASEVSRYGDITGASEGDIIFTSIAIAKLEGRKPIFDIDQVRKELEEKQKTYERKVATPTSGKRGSQGKKNKKLASFRLTMKPLERIVEAYPVGKLLFDIPDVSTKMYVAPTIIEPQLPPIIENIIPDVSTKMYVAPTIIEPQLPPIIEESITHKISIPDVSISPPLTVDIIPVNENSGNPVDVKVTNEQMLDTLPESEKEILSEKEVKKAVAKTSIGIASSILGAGIIIYLLRRNKA